MSANYETAAPADVTVNGDEFTAVVCWSKRMGATPVAALKFEKFTSHREDATPERMGFVRAAADILDTKSDGLFRDWKLDFGADARVRTPVYVSHSSREHNGELWVYFSSASGTPLVIVKLKRKPKSVYRVQVAPATDAYWVTVGRYATEDEAEKFQAELEGHWSETGITTVSRIVLG